MKSRNPKRSIYIAISLIIITLFFGCRSQKDGLQQEVLSDIDWVTIPSGTFIMGSPESELGREIEKLDDETQHKVSLDSFRISKYEVTFEQYDLFCKATKRDKPDDCDWGRGNRPVTNISWNDAKAFADWSGCRLPTEAEWEYACRAGSVTPFNTGEYLTTDQANYNGNFPYGNSDKDGFLNKTAAVGSYPPNAFGLFDMHGNVAEWCSDWAAEYPDNKQYNPTGPANGTNRIIRGGSWISEASRCRSAYRNGREPDFVNRYFGFRLVLDN